MIVVLDTNIWVSALQFGRDRTPPAQALEKAMREDVIATAKELEDEVVRVFTQKFHWDHQRAQDAKRSVLARSIRVQLSNAVTICRDPKDNIFLECAALAQADYLIAGDKDLLVLGSYADTRIITPSEYISLGI